MSPAKFTLLLAALTLAACGGDSTPSPGGHGGGSHGRPAEKPIPVATETVHTGPIARYYGATATLEAENEADVLSRVAGVVEKLEVEEGDAVEAGSILLGIDNDEYRLRLNQAEATTANLRSRFERMEKMLEQRLASTEEFETAKNEFATAEANEGLARLELSYTRVTAPFRGFVTQRFVDEGQNVSVGTPLFRLSDFEPLLARVHVPSKEFRTLQADQLVVLFLDSTGARLDGRITLVSPVIDPTSGTIKVTVEIDEYPAGTRPGDFAQVRIVTDSKEAAVLVPKGAVVTDKGEDVVYLDVAGAAERRVVEIGFTDDEWAEIVTGVTSGESVVVKGQRSLKHGTPLKVLEHDGAARVATSPTTDVAG